VLFLGDSPLTIAQGLFNTLVPSYTFCESLFPLSLFPARVVCFWLFRSDTLFYSMIFLPFSFRSDAAAGVIDRVRRPSYLLSGPRFLETFLPSRVSPFSLTRVSSPSLTLRFPFSPLGCATLLIAMRPPSVFLSCDRSPLTLA